MSGTEPNPMVTKLVIDASNQPDYDDVVDVKFDPKNWKKRPTRGTKTASIRFYVRFTTGEDQVKASNAFMKSGRRGKTKYLAGETRRVQFLNQVVKVEGIAVRDEHGKETDVTKPSPGLFALLPDWMLDQVFDAINQSEEEPAEGES